MGHKILLVEDHSDTANIFARMLRRDGYEVEIALTFADAERLCEGGSFDAVICDIQMPDGNGVDVLAAARRRNPETVGIVVSGHDEFSQREQARMAGFVSYILKPINYAALQNTLAECLAGDRTSSGTK